MPNTNERDALMLLIEQYAEERHKHGNPEYNHISNAARNAVIYALAAAAPNAGAPLADGFALVPIEPTKEMLRAYPDNIDGLDEDQARQAWADMLAAAPAQQARAPLAKTRGYPPLPGFGFDAGPTPIYTAQDMQDYVDADRAMLAAAPAQQAGPSDAERATARADALAQHGLTESDVAGAPLPLAPSDCKAVNRRPVCVECYNSNPSRCLSRHRALPAQATLPASEADGYATAFYELAALMGMTAQPLSPETVWREQMLPRLKAALATLPVCFALRWPENDPRLNLSTVFDTEAEAKEYAERCGPSAEIVPLYTRAQPQAETELRAAADAVWPMLDQTDPRTVRLYAALRAQPQAAAEPVARDTMLLDALRENSWDLRCIDIPTGQGDGDVHWIVVEHYMAAPVEREIGRCFTDEPRDAVEATIAAQTPGARGEGAIPSGGTDRGL